MPGEFVGTAHMVSIYGRKYDVIFLEIQGKIHADYQNHNKPVTNFDVKVS